MNNKGIAEIPPKPPSNLANFPRPAIIVEEMKDEDRDYGKTLKIGKDSSSNNMLPKK